MSSNPKVKFDQRYRCYVPSLGSEAFYDAKSRGQARFKCWNAVREAGYKIGFGDIEVRLAYVAEESMNYFIRQEDAATADKGRL